jgi:hypothetical protein
MSGIQIKVVPESAEFLIGMSLPVHITITNLQPTPREVPDTLAFSEFEFVLRPEGNGGDVRTLSQRAAQFIRNPDPSPDSPKRIKSLDPGGTSQYEEDLSNYALPPLNPGRYLLSVVHSPGNERYESPTTPLAIVPPRVGSLATAPSQSRATLGTVFAHVTAKGDVDLYQREGLPGRPNDGITYRRFGSVQPSVADSVALAIDLDEDEGPRWFAWLQQGSIGASVGQEKAVFTRIDPAPVGLKTLSLFSTGWQESVNSATFAMLGTNDHGKVIFVVATFTIGATKPTLSLVELSAAGIPMKWCASYRVKNGTPVYDVVWSEVLGKKTRISKQTVSLATGVAEKPVVLIERESPLAALSISPVGQDGNGFVDALFGPFGESPKIQVIRMSLNGGAPIGDWVLDAPTDDKKRTAAKWTLSSATLSESVVVAKFGDTLVGQRVKSNGTWSVVAEKAGQADNIRVEAIDQQSIWVVWTEPTLGIHYDRIR